ncbi:MAG TPA: hypothetical protein DDZ41_05775, partial [Flavobacterium sp.]|nr:hypothetical protein [Flavobacterium sp.]
NIISKNPSCHIHDNNSILLKIIPIVLKGKFSEIKSYALLDEGSTVSLMDENLANQLGLDGPNIPLTLQWTNNKINEQRDSKVVSVDISGIDKCGSKYYTLRRVKTVNNLALPSQTVNIDYLSKK